jgi:hypothetical protein
MKRSTERGPSLRQLLQGHVYTCRSCRRLGPRSDDLFLQHRSRGRQLGLAIQIQQHLIEH